MFSCWGVRCSCQKVELWKILNRGWARDVFIKTTDAQEGSHLGVGFADLVVFKKSNAQVPLQNNYLQSLEVESSRIVIFRVPQMIPF